MLARFLDHQRSNNSLNNIEALVVSSSDDSWKASANVQADDNCSLCKESLIFSSTSTLPCGHSFHDDCVEVLRSLGVLSQVCSSCRSNTNDSNKGTQLNEEASRIFLVIERRVSRSETNWNFLSSEDQMSINEAISIWNEATSLGNLNAMNNMGLLYLHGRGVKQDPSEARPWFQRASDLGFPESQFNLGGLYLSGSGVTQNDTETVVWYRRAADQGHTFALLELGDMYEKGRGVEQSDSEAARCWRKAAYQGVARAQYNIAVMYREGRGVEQSYLDAGRWYTKAAYQGFGEAQYDLGVMYDQGEGVEQSSQEAIRWWMKAADKGNARAMADLGLHFHEGKGVELSYTEAVWWWSQAADLGNVMAQCNLGCMLYEGIGVAQDRIRSRKLLQSAAAQGDEVSRQALLKLTWDDNQKSNKPKPMPRPRSKKGLPVRTRSSTIPADSFKTSPTGSTGSTAVIPGSKIRASISSGGANSVSSSKKSVSTATTSASGTSGRTPLKKPPKKASRDPRKLVRNLL